jgi:hypothetical protein
MHRTAIIAAAFVASACSFSAEKPVVEVEQSMSGLTLDGGLHDGPAGEMEPTYLVEGEYRGQVMDVMVGADMRADLYAGAEMKVELKFDPQAKAYVVNGQMELQGMNGRLRGISVEEQVDHEFDCVAVVEMEVRGRSRSEESFQLIVEQTTEVRGGECDLSNLGPARVGEVAYRARFMAE